RQHEKKGGAVDAAVIAAEGNFAEVRHFSATGFVDDLSGLRFVLEINLGSLGCGEELQNAFGNLRSNPEHLHSGDDAVAAKDGTEPRHARIRIVRFRIAQSHHLYVGERAADPGGEAVIGAGDLAEVGRGGFQLSLGASYGAGVSDGTSMAGGITI